MLVPVVRKIKENKKCYVERVFPVDGVLSVEIGDFVKSFDHLGECRFSQNALLLPKGFKPFSLKGDKKFYYSGSLLGKFKSEKVYAPYDGNLSVTEDKEYIFEENEKKYVLLSGVWGSVKSIFEKKAVLIETQTKDVLFTASTDRQVSGELVVFPNPTDVLKRSYLEGFAKGIKGKIVYIGHFAGLDIIKKAFEMDAAAVIVGSAHKEVFDFAKSNNFAFGVFSGFGKIKTPENVYKLLSSVSYRFVFFEGDKSILRIPVQLEDLSDFNNTGTPSSSAHDPEFVKHIDTGMSVQVLQEPYFGWIGTVDRVSESSIFVKFGIGDKSVEIRSPNFLIFE